MPRIETSQTLARSLAPAAVATEGQLSFDAGTDRLTAARLLQSQEWAVDWRKRDPRAFNESVASLVTTAHALARAAAAVPEPSREAHWEAARELLAPIGGPGSSERLLARVAMEWAALAPTPASDALFSLRPSAWIVLRAGGTDPLAEQLLALSDLPGLLIDCDPPDERLFEGGEHVSLTPCHAFEHEAQCAAAQVLVHVRDGHVPVGLVSQDRVLVRRIRALLERQQVQLQDETGWKLSTTRAAAQVMSLLQAAGPTSSTDLLLDWLKAGSRTWPELGDVRRPLAELEQACRGHGWSRPSAIDATQLSATTAAFWARVAGLMASLSEPSRLPLPNWLILLREALQSSGAWPALAADDAGLQVLLTLRLSGAGLSAVAAQTAMDLDAFVAWADGVLEDASFVPPVPEDTAEVVITPLARVMLRPFAALVFPGADDRHLGASGAPDPLLSDAQAVALGLPGAEQRRRAETLAFSHAMRVPRVNLLYRHMDGSEPLAASPLVERLALRAAGRRLAESAEARVIQTVMPAPMAKPLPQAADLLPERLSASACEALRACPYRFFALQLLRLRDADELGAEVEKRDYGTWLHAVLFEFHQQREAPASMDIEIARLHEIALQQQAALGLADADFLPYAASFAELAPRYVTWLHERDAAGAQWWQGEHEHQTSPAALRGVALYGRIDRADRLPLEAGSAIELIDYKTGSAEGLRKQVKQPLEDTQLAFYAALMQSQTDRPLRAQYLALDGAKGIEPVVHADVEDSARALIEGLGEDLQNIREGANLQALGEGSACEHCVARGLCRRDQWTAA